MKAHRTKFSLYPILNRNSPVPLKTKIQIYLLYIRLLLTYAAEAWGPYICHIPTGNTSSLSKSAPYETVPVCAVTSQIKQFVTQLNSILYKT